MLRADYCGDGTSNTPDAVPIEVFDGFGTKNALHEGLALEAEWTPMGARCVERTRVGAALAYVEANCPGRLARAQPAYECGGRNSTLHTEKGYFVPAMQRSWMVSRMADH